MSGTSPQTNQGRIVFCPYGSTYTIPVILATAALMMTRRVRFSCYYFETTSVNYDVFGNTEPHTFSVGPWAVQDFSAAGGNVSDYGTVDPYCVSWDDHNVLSTSDMDAPLKFARVMVLFTSIAAFITYFIFLLGSCVILKPFMLRCISALFFLYGVLMMLSLVALASYWCSDAQECVLQWNGIMAIVAFFVWIFAGLAIQTMRERELPSRPNVATATAVEMAPTPPVTKTVEQTIVEEDGTIVKFTSTTVNNPDGTTTVTETRTTIHNGQPAVAVSAAAANNLESGIPDAKAIPVPY